MGGFLGVELATRQPPPGTGIHYLPWLISQAANCLPELDLITLHCSFEMFTPDEMTAMLQAASRKLRSGGRLVILPLYLAEERTVYADAALPRALPQQHACRVGVRDYWNVAWSEWHAPETLASRLVHPFPELACTVYRIANPEAVYPGIYMRFVGTWEKE